MQIKNILMKAGNFVQKNSPYILTGLGCAGVVSTAIMTGKAASKATTDIEVYSDQKTSELSQEELKDLGCPHGYEPTLKEKVKLTWKYFIPPIVMGATSVGCIIGAQTVNTRRHAALASLYTLSEQTLKDYRENVKEIVGKNKEEKAYDKVQQDRLVAEPPKDGSIILTGKGETLFRDAYSGRYFKSDIETLRRIENELNHNIVHQMWVSVNDLYMLIGLDGIKLGDDIGWDPDQLIEFKFIPTIYNKDSEDVCIILDYEIRDFR